MDPKSIPTLAPDVVLGSEFPAVNAAFKGLLVHRWEEVVASCDKKTLACDVYACPLVQQDGWVWATNTLADLLFVALVCSVVLPATFKVVGFVLTRIMLSAPRDASSTAGVVGVSAAACCVRRRAASDRTLSCFACRRRSCFLQ